MKRRGKGAIGLKGERKRRKRKKIRQKSWVNQDIGAGNEHGSWENSKDAQKVESREKNDFDSENKTNSTEVVDANHTNRNKCERN